MPPSDLTSNPLTNCSLGAVSGTVTCLVTCAATSQVVFTGPCGANPILSPSIVSNCTNGTGYVTVVDALSIPGSWSVAEKLILQVNASVTVAGSLFVQSASNISLSAVITVVGDFIVFPNSNVSVNVSAGVREWVTSQGLFT